MLAERHPSAQVPLRVLAWGFVASLAALLGSQINQRPILVAALVGAAVVGTLVFDLRLKSLVVLAILALAWGSSMLPLVSAGFVVKFALLTAVCATVFISAAKPQESHLPVPRAFSIAFLGLVAFALASATWSIAPSDTVSRAASMLLVWFAATIAVPLAMRDPADAEELLYRLGLTLGAVSAAGFALAAVGIVPMNLGGRFAGLMADANTLGYFAAPLLPPLVVLATRSPAGRHRRSMVLAIAATGVGIAASGSRGGTLAAISGIVAGLFVSTAAGQARQAKWIVAIAIIGIAATFAVFSALGLSVRSQRQGNVEGFFQVGSGSFRTTTWGDVIRLIEQKPVVGYGFATAPVILPTLSFSPSSVVLGRTHNSYLEAGLELGWLGAAWLVALGVSALAAVWPIARARGPHQTLAMMLIAGVVGGLVEGIFESGLLAAGGLIAFPFWTVAALAHSLRIRSRRTGDAAVGVDQEDRRRPIPASTSS